MVSLVPGRQWGQGFGGVPGDRPKIRPGWQNLRRACKKRDGGRCVLCSVHLTGHWECHHRKFKSRGGGDHLANLVMLCSLCHRAVHEERVPADSGLALWPSADPAKVPARVHGVLVMLDDDGEATPVPAGDWRSE